jgi:hypothetical protein
MVVPTATVNPANCLRSRLTGKFAVKLIKKTGATRSIMRIDQPRRCKAWHNRSSPENGWVSRPEIHLSAQRFRPDPQACINFRMALLHSHNFWSFSSTSENHKN